MSNNKYELYGIALGFLVFATIIVIGLVAAFSEPIVFQAQARVWVQPKVAEMVPSQSQSSMYAPLTSFWNSPISTAGQVLQSDVVISRTCKKLENELGKSRCPTAGQVRAGLSVSGIAETDILIVKYQSGDPELCKLVLQAVLDSFVEENSTQSAQSATQSRIFLEKQLKEAQRHSLQARQKLKDFQDKYGAINLETQTAGDLELLQNLTVSVSETRADISELKSKIAYLQSELRISPEDAMVAQMLTQDDDIRILRKKISADEVRLIELKSKFRDAHPRVQGLTKVIAESKFTLQERIRQVAAEVGVDAPARRLFNEDPIQKRLLGEMVEARSNEIAARTKLDALEAQRDAQKALLTHIPQRQLELAELNRSAEVATSTLTTIEENLNSMKLLETVSATASNIQVLDKPQTPGMPLQTRSSMTIAVSVLLGILLGVASFFAIRFLNPAIRSVRQVIDLIDLPIVGWIERFASATQRQDVLPGLQRLRINLRSWLDKGKPTIVVVSSDAEDGKTLLASGLAVSLAQSGTSVTLVDTSFVHPSIHQVFDEDNSPGLSDYLCSQNPESFPNIARPIMENLRIVPAGTASTSPGVFGQPIFKKLIDTFHEKSDVVIIDTAATTESDSALELLSRDTKVLAVVQLGHTYRQTLRMLSVQLSRLAFGECGIVLFNASEQSLSSELIPQTVEEKGQEETAEASRW